MVSRVDYQYCSSGFKDLGGEKDILKSKNSVF